jgi:hypothetical protein
MVAMLEDYRVLADQSLTMSADTPDVPLIESP